jgi:cytoskeletal protein CcmA (bactofilin family)
VSDSRTIEGDLEVADDLDFSGTVLGSITVNDGGSLHLMGVCRGDLHVRRGGHAVISGTVAGNLENQGSVELWGAIQGNVTTASRQYHQSPAARIGGQLCRSDA